ncbi:hypothetical protein KP509_02G080800 [Ceratopteris richardii]|uniref:Bifunctional inhibitor/plant lipid transfer protein/seed storage helical domain-containing protein n=1 Tax=Ceratopteris richardii TaxID=49495 RepID=A0A8T2VEW4_CERRI|nr:hypothetical protein KP509_02G080800 [Ceratopteris richardii]
MDNKSVFPAALMLVAMVIMSSSSVQAITANVDCGKVRNYFFPCLGYLVNPSNSPSLRPSPSCCSSLFTLNKLSRGPIRVGVCECIKQDAPTISGLNQNHVSDISTKCGIPLAVKVSPSTDCSKA